MTQYKRLDFEAFCAHECTQVYDSRTKDVLIFSPAQGGGRSKTNSLQYTALGARPSPEIPPALLYVCDNNSLQNKHAGSTRYWVFQNLGRWGRRWRNKERKRTSLFFALYVLRWYAVQISASRTDTLIDGLVVLPSSSRRLPGEQGIVSLYRLVFMTGFLSNSTS